MPVGIPCFDQEEASILPGPLPGSPVSGAGSPAHVAPTDIGAPPADAPSDSVLRYCLNFLIGPLRAVMREELASAAPPAANVSTVATEVVNAAVPAFAAAVPVANVPRVEWALRGEDEIKLGTTKVFPNKLIRKVFAEKMCIRMLVLFNLVDSCGDVLTLFFPPQSKADSSDPFVLKHFDTFCLSVLQGLYKAMHARGSVPDVLSGRGRVFSSRLDAVDEAFLNQLRTIFNDGRSAARALFYRMIAFFFMQASPKVSIRLVNAGVPVPDVADADGSPFFEIETSLVATADGVVAPIINPPLPPSAAHGPSGGAFTSVKSLMNYTGALGGAETITREIGTDSSFTTVDGAHYPHVAGEHLVKQRTCIFRFSRRLARQVVKGKVAVDEKVIFAIAMCVRSMLSGPQIAWTAPNGSDWGCADVIGPCKWWLLVPRPTSRLTVSRKVQTLTKEEQHAMQLGGNVAGGMLNAELDGDEEEEDVDGHVGPEVEGAGDMELDE